MTWPTVVRRNMHQTRPGIRCYRWPLRALQRAYARSCSTSPSARCSPLTIMGGAAYPRVSPPEISEVAALPKGGQPASQRWRGARSQRASGVQRVWHAAGTSSSYGGMVCATTSLLSRGPLGVRRWAGRSMCDSLVRRARSETSGKEPTFTCESLVN